MNDVRLAAGVGDIQWEKIFNEYFLLNESLPLFPRVVLRTLRGCEQFLQFSLKVNVYSFMQE